MAEPTSPKIVLVFLATGRQGRGVVHALAKANEAAREGAEPWLILAQTRDPASAKSKALASLRGVRLHKGVPTEPAALFASAPGPVYAVFSVQQSYENPKGVAGETVEANGIADAAAAHGVKHFVYTSVNLGGGGGHGCPASKRLAEKHLKEKHPTLPTTILRPVTFMDEFIPDDPDSATARLTKLILLTQLRPTTRVQCVACSDIGGVAALVLAHPERYIGKDFDIAGESLAPKDFEDGWREVFREELRPKMIGGNTLAWAVRTGKKELRLMFKFFNEAGFNVNIPAVRGEYPELKDWRAFLRASIAA
ncbi:nucleoside-diphosphate-sugar epimerase family protein [Mycena olivaceomarginata]|nr:nucleoside-diphosphate-sugar epimerase family protein [Mycena olivaceomarginata]